MEQVLLIEGHRLMRNALGELLKSSGFQAVIAIDPMEAVVKTNLLSPHIIILDTTWHEVKGLSLSRRLRELAPDSRIVLLVDEGWNVDQEIKESSGADAYIAKSVLMEQLPPLLATWNNRLNRTELASP